uniref:Uncharacterized protein TCIL3000_10_8660 n=1 Tax=Trypanosoma congolense (strain IL3000) TaxID=1068625 RepID=G0UXH3_TRYCI|nr:unnamed protein product [Trypanosoma congolense IL3000]
MQKLLITIHECHIMHAPSRVAITPCVSVVVGNTLKFSVQSNTNSFCPHFGQCFTTDFVDYSTAIEVLVYSYSIGDAVVSHQLLGTCRVAIRKLFEGRRRVRRKYFLADENGIAGTVCLTMKLEPRYDANRKPSSDVDGRSIRRLLRFLLKHDKSRLCDMDLLLSSVADGELSLGSLPLAANCPSEASWGDHATFEELMGTLCNDYHRGEPPVRSTQVVLEKCTHLEEQTSHHSSNVIVVVRSAAEEFVSSAQPYTISPVWEEPLPSTTFDVVDPETFALDVIVYCVSSSSGLSEVGRGQVYVSTLILGQFSKRIVYIFRNEDIITSCVTGVVHLTLKPIGFGLPPLLGGEAELLHNRFNRFFYRYDRRILQDVDLIVHSQINNGLHELVHNLEAYYGLEQGVAVLFVTIVDANMILTEPSTELDDDEIIVVLTMGDQIRHTSVKHVDANCRTVFDEVFRVDVSRKTDIIRFQVVKAGQEDTVHGTVDFACFKIQNGKESTHTLYLVGAAGTKNAFISGSLTVSMFSEDVGQPHAIDLESEEIYAGRLRRYLERRVPEKLHIVHLVVATVFDIDGFMKEISRDYGAEGPSYVLHLTVVGCRRLRRRLGFSMDAYVMARMGIDRVETRVVRDSTKPDYYEFFDFFFEGLTNTQLTLTVMDRYETGTDKEMGRVVIPMESILPDLQHNHWLPLLKRGLPTGSIIGVSFVVMDLRLNDTTCICSNGNKVLGSKDKPVVVALTNEKSPEVVQTPHKSKMLQPRLSSWAVNLWRTSMRHLWREAHTGDDDGAAPCAARATPTRTKVCLELADIIDDSVCSTSELFLRFKKHGSVSKASRTLNGLLGGHIAPTQKEVLPSLEGMYLVVHLHHCDGVGEGWLIPPSPYVMFTTPAATCVSKVAFQTCSPQYGETFHFPVANPDKEFLCITVITDTSHGKKTVGHCMLSLKNVLRDIPVTRRVALVTPPHGTTLVQCGVVCVTLTGKNFGPCCVLPTDEECRLRQWMYDILTKRAPLELHRLEWYVGQLSFMERKTVWKFIIENVDTQSEGDGVNVLVDIKSVANMHCDGFIVEAGLCYVTAEVNGKKVYRTTSVQGADGSFNFEEKFSVAVPQPFTQFIRFVVCTKVGSKHVYGECVVSPLDFYHNAVYGRTHYVVENAGLPSATPVGYITVVMSCELCERMGIPSLWVGGDHYTKMRDFYYYYLHEELHRVNVDYNNVADVDSHIQTLARIYGPAPGIYHLRLVVLRYICSEVVRGDSYFALEMGLLRFRSLPSTRAAGHALQETFDIVLGLPEKDELHLVILTSSKRIAVDVEIGRTVIPLKNIVRKKACILRLPLIRYARTGRAVSRGFVEVALFTNDFGLSTDQQRPVLHDSLCELIRMEVSRSEPKELHNVPNVLAQMQLQGLRIRNNTIASRLERGVPELGGPTRVVLVGLRFFPVEADYIKIKVKGGKTLLCMEELAHTELSCINKEFLIDEKIAHENTVFTLKVAQQGSVFLRTLCRCDFTLSGCSRENGFIKWLNLFDPMNRAMGELGVQLLSPVSCRPFSPQKEFHSSDVERVTDDIISLLLKHNPEELRKVDVIVNQAAELSMVHRLHRRRLAPHVLATLYCRIQKVLLLHPVQSNLLVRASSGGEVVRVVERTYGERVVEPSEFNEWKDNLYHHIPSFRLDITTVDILRLSVCDADGRQEVELGCAVLSLYALLTPLLYSEGDVFSVPLVKQCADGLEAQAVVVGTMSLSFTTPLYESHTGGTQVDVELPEPRGRFQLKQCLEKVCRTLQYHDANLLVDIHKRICDELVAKTASNEEFSSVIKDLLEPPVVNSKTL